MTLVTGSHGQITIDDDGYVHSCACDCDTDCGCKGLGYSDITRVNTYEYKKFWGLTRMENADILDVAYWCTREGVLVYEPAEADWRVRLVTPTPQ